MFVSFATDSGIRFDAHFYDAQTDKVETRPVTGWVTGDDGITQATVLVPVPGVQLRVGQIDGFLAVVPKGQEKEHQAILDAKVEAFRKQVSAKTVTEAKQPAAEA